ALDRGALPAADYGIIARRDSPAYPAEDGRQRLKRQRGSSMEPEVPNRERSAMPGPLKDEFTQVAPGQISAVVTHLEMRTKLPLRREHAKQGEYALRRQTEPELGWYRELYRRVGQDWMWFSRLPGGGGG